MLNMQSSVDTILNLMLFLALILSVSGMIMMLIRRKRLGPTIADFELDGWHRTMAGVLAALASLRIFLTWKHPTMQDILITSLWLIFSAGTLLARKISIRDGGVILGWSKPKTWSQIKSWEWTRKDQTSTWTLKLHPHSGKIVECGGIRDASKDAIDQLLACTGRNETANA